MQKALRLSRVFGGLIIKIGITFFLILSFASHASSDTVFEDIQIELGIEIGNGLDDYDDADLVIEKGRFVEYKITVTNNGNMPHSDIVVQMDAPDYMAYVSGTTYMNSGSGYDDYISDSGGMSGLNIGYILSNIDAGQSVSFYAQYQVEVPEDVLDDLLYTLAWANAWGIYSAIPKVSNPVENVISGEAIPLIQVQVTADPEAGTSVYTGYTITYTYTLKNVGGVLANNVFLTVDAPDYTSCAEGCGNAIFGSIESNESATHEMEVTVLDIPEDVTEIINTGYDVGGDNFETIENREAIVHIVDPNADPQEGEFRVEISQVPNIILNSPDGIAQRADNADLTETEYVLIYQGRGKEYTYPVLSTYERTTITNGDCGTYTYDNKWGAYTYAYNSYGGGCSNIYGCPPYSSPIVFNVSTVLPETAPKLLFTIDNTVYEFGVNAEVNAYMKDGGIISVPSIFTESRAVENGANGIVNTEVITTVSEDYYQYVQTGTVLWCYGDCSGEDCEPPPIYRPVYTWVNSNSEPLELTDTDATDITVYTSTAWLKTEGGHIGTNDVFTNEGDTLANYVDLPYDEEDPLTWTNTYVKTAHLTPSSVYTPPDEFNADYLIFGRNGTGDMKTSCGQEWEGQAACDDWYVTGTEFPFIQRGEAYDRENNPRDYDADMLVREKFGDVITNELPSLLTGVVELGDNTIWNNTGDITIGQGNNGEVVTFSGGQSRIYTTGDVYINANIQYAISNSASYNDITSVRIDANNIYVSGEVEDLEVMLLARNEFHSGISKKQLRILGDVITGQSYWEREPLLEFSPEEFNKPSEHIIEDMRKYVVPVPGDTEVPDDYTIWRQVNPATGEVLDGY